MTLQRYIAPCLSVFFCFACEPKSKTKTLQVRVVWHSNPQEQAIISWTSEEADSQGTVYYGLNPASDPSAYEYQIEAQEKGQYNSTLLFSANQNPYYHTAFLKDLSPDTKYYFRVQNGEQLSSQYAFRTAPEHEEISLLFGGDSRSDQYNRQKMNYVTRDIWENDPNVRALVHGGDYVENGALWSQWSVWFEDYMIVQKDDGEILPIIPTRGNHEDDKVLYNQIFGHPGSEGNGYFKVSFGEADLLVLNTEESITGDQFHWLQEELQKSSEKRWIFPNYHVPAFPAIKRPGPARQHWVPMFEDFQVDLAFESDGHAFKKTAPVYRDQIDQEKGIIYIGEGGLGVKQREPDPERWYLKNGGYTFKKHHIIKLTIQGDETKVEAFSNESQVFDSFTLKMRERTPVF